MYIIIYIHTILFMHTIFYSQKNHKHCHVIKMYVGIVKFYLEPTTIDLPSITGYTHFLQILRIPIYTETQVMNKGCVIHSAFRFLQKGL